METEVIVVIDTDGDGVPDSLDQCPDTPADVEVDEFGCPLDGDMDGVFDYLDDCLYTPFGAHVNEYGCWVIEAPLFETNEADIKPEFYASLDEVAKIINDNPELLLEIQGHADIRGTEEYNLKLSERRAKAVESYFVSQGIDPERMDAVGYGFSRPVASNDTPEGMAKNRRVEIESIRIIVVE
jgi:OOP family OmpA-OmpF porin